MSLITVLQFVLNLQQPYGQERTMLLVAELILHFSWATAIITEESHLSLRLFAHISFYVLTDTIRWAHCYSGFWMRKLKFKKRRQKKKNHLRIHVGNKISGLRLSLSPASALFTRNWIQASKGRTKRTYLLCVSFYFKCSICCRVFLFRGISTFSNPPYSIP